MTAIAPHALDHVALWVAERDTLASFLCDHLGMHEIERTDRFTLVGADARLGKLTLFDADGPREPGVLERVALSVSDLDAALDRLPGDLITERIDDDTVAFEAPEGLGLSLVREPNAQVEYDINHVVLRVPDPARVREELSTLGFQPRDGNLAIAEKELHIDLGDRRGEGSPPLKHPALPAES